MLLNHLLVVWCTFGTCGSSLHVLRPLLSARETSTVGVAKLLSVPDFVLTSTDLADLTILMVVSFDVSVFYHSCKVA